MNTESGEPSAPSASRNCLVLTKRAVARCIGDNGLLLRIDYQDRNGTITRRFVTPIGFAGKQQERFRAMCLCRQEPRQFEFGRVRGFKFCFACDLVLPVELETIDESKLERPETADEPPVGEEIPF